MENPFKNIIQHEQVPEILRERVMDDIRLVKLTMDFADLITFKYPSSIVDLIGTSAKKGVNKNDEDEKKNASKDPENNDH